MPSYFEKLEDSEINAGEYTSFGGDFIAADGVRQGSGGPKEPVSYFANGRNLKITGGNYTAFGGDFYGGHSRSMTIPIAPMFPGPVPQGSQYENNGEYTHPHPSTPQRRATYGPTAPPEHGILLVFGLRFLA